MTTSAGATVVSGVSYNAANQLLGITYNGIAETRGYNVLNQLTSIAAGSTENLTYTYPTGTNNGKISSMYNAISGETITYTYDSLNRLATAAGSGWGEAYTFDGFGNLNAKTVTSGSGPSLSLTTNPANNQMDGIYETSYDANGNVLGNTGIAAYDSENRISTVNNGTLSGLQYGYDAQNRRTFLWPGTFDTFYPTNEGNPTAYSVVMYSPTGQKLGTYQINTYNSSVTNIVVSMCSTLMSSDQYFGGRRLAPLDQLGSAGAYYPWGENKGSTNPQNTWGFGTYWQDSATSLDYANNRYYSNAYGRFMTPDPAGRHAARVGDPQSWNRYAYTRGDPVNRRDQSGLDDDGCTELDDGTYDCGVIVIDNVDDVGDADPGDWGASDDSGPSAGYACAFGFIAGCNAASQQGQGESLYSALAAAQLTASAPGATQSQQQALNAGLNAAWAHIISNPGCANFLTNYSEPIAEAWGQLGTILTNTTYTFGSTPPGTAATTTEGGNQVTISTSGAFLSGSGSGLFQVTTATSQYLFTNIAAVDALILLHELGHETGALPSDLTNSSQNATNTADIVTNCFTKMANGTYQ